jgi:hypothetical protein
LRAIQCLNLAFLVHAQHHGLIRRVQIDAHHVRQFADEVGIGGQLKGPDAVRFETVRLPNALIAASTSEGATGIRTSQASS